jgi:hypothetical protein
MKIFTRILKLAIICGFILSLFLSKLFIHGIEHPFVVSVHCEIEGKKLYIQTESNHPGFWECYFNRDYCVTYTRSLLYESNDQKQVIIKYEYPRRDFSGDSISLLLSIAEENDGIAIYYNHEPAHGFILENNPFSKELQFIQAKPPRTDEKLCAF